MAVITLTNVTFGFAHPPLLENTSLKIEHGDRVGLLGRNGAGKSTLLKLITGALHPDDGDVVIDPDVRVGLLQQSVDSDCADRAFELVASGLSAHGDLIADHYRVFSLGESARRTAAEIEEAMNAFEAWPLIARVERALSRVQLDADLTFNELSTGMQRRVLLARALVEDPQLLLLDEPTNHLDIPAIEWLERFLQGYRGTLVFVTHDRAFLQRLATRIVEVDRGQLLDWTCDYPTFLERKMAALEAQQKQEALFDKKLAAEERWIRQGIKARRTRNEGRVRALKQLREQHRARRKQVGNVRLETNEGERSGQLVLQARGLGCTVEEQTLFENFDLTITRGDRIGIIGRNGCGKSTLLRILLEQQQPTRGTLRLGTNLQIAYFDQNRDQLDESQSAVENIGEGTDHVVINGRKKHVHGYLQDFLFTPERSRTLVRYLSGGERNRLMLAKVLSRPSNLLVLDEPTNDLDEETLELLEEWLMDYPGTVLCVSHDREFLNRVVTSLLSFDPDGQLREYDGGYDDWVRQYGELVPAASVGLKQPEGARSSDDQATSRTVESIKPQASSPGTNQPKAPRKLSYKEQKELDSLPERIAELEQQLARLHERMAEPEFYQQDSNRISEATEQASRLQEELDTAFLRWEELES